MDNELLNNKTKHQKNQINTNEFMASIYKNMIEEQKPLRKCHSFDNNEEQFEMKCNMSNNNMPISDSNSAISYTKEDLKNRINNKNVNDMSLIMRKNNYNNDSIFGDNSPTIKKKSSSNTINPSKNLANLRKHYLKENKNDENIQKDKTRIKRPNYLIKSCFYNNNDNENKYKFMRSFSKNESSPVLDFYGFKDENQMLKKFYKHSTFGKINFNNNNNNMELLYKNENDYDNIKFEPNNNKDFLKDNDDSFIKIIHGDSSDDDNKDINSFFGDKNDFANEIDLINKMKDKEDTLSNLINLSFKSQIIEKHHNLNDSLNIKTQMHNHSVNLSEGSIFSNRSLNDEFVFRNHSKIFKSNHNNKSLSVNNSSSKIQEDKTNTENNNLNRSDKHNILTYLKNNMNNNNQKYNNDYSEEEFDNRQYTNNTNNYNIHNNNNNNIHLSKFKNNNNEINNFKHKKNFEIKNNMKDNNIIINENNNMNYNNDNVNDNNINDNNMNYNNNNLNDNMNDNNINYNNNLNDNNNINAMNNINNNYIYSNTINNINNSNNSNCNNNFNQFFPQINNKNNNNINNINNNYLQNLNYLNYLQNNGNNNMPNPYINNTINFIYNNNMNLFYNNPYNDVNKQNMPMQNIQNINNINNNNFSINNNNNNLNYNFFPYQNSNPNFQMNQIFNTNNNNIINNLNNINNNNNNYYPQQQNIINYNNTNSNNNNHHNHINQKNYQKQQKYIGNNNNNSNNNNGSNIKNNEKIKDFTKISNEELAKQANILAKSQEGSRYLEKIIDSNPSIVSTLFFPYTLGYFEELSNNKYGNFYIKKIIKHLSKDLLGKLIEFLFPMIARIGTNQYGSKIIEQLIKSIKDDDVLLYTFIKEIIPVIILLINDLNGTHIIYKLLLLKSKYIRLIEEHICNNIQNIYVTREGSNLLKKYFDIINKESNNMKNYDKLIFFINAINNNLSLIITDQFGNYVIRHIILNLNYNINNVIIQNIIKNIVYYSNQKYSSNVVENCMDNNYVKEYILNELTKQYIFNNIFLNEYGNYVIQKAISLADDEKKDIFFKYIIQVTRQLQTLPFGSKLLSKLLMNYPTLSMYILSIYK